MKAGELARVFGHSIAIAVLVFALFAGGKMTRERLESWLYKASERRSVKPSEKFTERVDSLRLDRRAITPSPRLPRPELPSLPPDYSIFVLCYHDFRESLNKWAISPKRLEAHLQTLKALGFSFLTMSEVVDLLSGRWNGRFPRKVIAITVDDGFRSAYTVLFPLLKRYNAKATLFVYTSWIGKSSNSLTWEQLKEMAFSGLVEIGSHTVTHAYPRRLKRYLSPEQFKRRLEWEFLNSKKELERRLGIKVNGLAYPGGYADEVLKALAKRAGYRWATVVNPTPITVNVNLYALPRYGVSSKTTVAMLKAWVTKQPFQPVRTSVRRRKGVEGRGRNSPFYPSLLGKIP